MSKICQLTKIFIFSLMLSTVYAQYGYSQNGINIQQVTQSHAGIAGVDKTENKPMGYFDSSVFFDYSSNPLKLLNDNEEDIFLVNESSNTYLNLRLGLLPRVLVDISLPVSTYNSIDRETSEFEYYGDYSGSLADTTASASLNIFNYRTFGLSLKAFTKIPTGSPELFTGDGAVSYGGLGIISGNISSTSWSLNGGIHFRPEESYFNDDRIGEVIVGSESLLNAGISIGLSSISRAEFGLNHRSQLEETSTYNMSSTEAQGRLKFKMGSNYRFYAGGSLGLGEGNLSSDYKIITGISWVNKSEKKAKAKMVRTISSKPKQWYEVEAENIDTSYMPPKRKTSRTKKSSKSFGY